MPRRALVTSVVLALSLVACGGGDGERGSDAGPAPPQAATTVAAGASPCDVKPLTFGAERWQTRAHQPAIADGVLWEQAYTFTNPNTVPVELTSLFVVLHVNDTGGHHLKTARTAFRPAPDEQLPPGGSQERFAQAWLAAGNTPSTNDLYAATSTTVGGSECTVPVERITVGAPSPALQALVSCEPGAPAPC